MGEFVEYRCDDFLMFVLNITLSGFNLEEYQLLVEQQQQQQQQMQMGQQ